MRSDISEFRDLKALKTSFSERRRNGTLEERKAIQAEIKEKISLIASNPEPLAKIQLDLFQSMADIIDQIALLEGEMMRELRSTVGE
jgi:hypothetical protein